MPGAALSSRRVPQPSSGLAAGDSGWVRCRPECQTHYFILSVWWKTLAFREVTLLSRANSGENRTGTLVLAAKPRRATVLTRGLGSIWPGGPWGSSLSRKSPLSCKSRGHCPLPTALRTPCRPLPSGASSLGAGSEPTLAGLWARGQRGHNTAKQSWLSRRCHGSRRCHVERPAPKPGLTGWRSATHPGLLLGGWGGALAHAPPTPQARRGTRRWCLSLWGRAPRLQSERKTRRLTSHLTQVEHFKVTSLNLTFWAF